MVSLVYLCNHDKVTSLLSLWIKINEIQVHIYTSNYILLCIEWVIFNWFFLHFITNKTLAIPIVNNIHAYYCMLLLCLHLQIMMSFFSFSFYFINIFCIVIYCLILTIFNLSVFMDFLIWHILFVGGKSHVYPGAVHTRFEHSIGYVICIKFKMIGYHM